MAMHTVAPNWQLYDIADEDHSRDHDFRDPREIETLEEVVSPGYDSGGSSLSNPLPPFHPRLSQFDTQIWEMCDLAAPKVLMPHRDSSSILPDGQAYSYHYQIQPIMNWAGVNAETAEIISEIGLALNATKEMMRKFCKEAKKDFGSFLCKMTPLVDGVTEIEESFEKPWMPEIPAGIRVNHGTLKTLYRMLPDENGEDEDEIESKETGATIGFHIFEDFSEIKDKRRELWDWYRTFYGWKDYYEEDSPDRFWDLRNRIFDSEDERYLSDDEVENQWYPKFNWVRQQGKQFIELLKQVYRGDRLEIGKLANDVMESRVNLSDIQATVFFTAWNIRREYLEKHEHPAVKKIIAKIFGSNGRLGYIGFQLHLIQNGDHPRSKIELQKHEWSRVWGAYKLEKELQSSRRGLIKAKRELGLTK